MNRIKIVIGSLWSLFFVLPGIFVLLLVQPIFGAPKSAYGGTYGVSKIMIKATLVMCLIYSLLIAALYVFLKVKFGNG
jgi:hypothetical protein